MVKVYYIVDKRSSKINVVLKMFANKLNEYLHSRKPISIMNLNIIDSQILINNLYKKNYEPTLENGQQYDIPASGSLGLLATGYTGLIAWRKKKAAAQLQ